MNKELLKRGHKVRVMTDKDPRLSYEIEGVQVVSRPNNWHDHYLWADIVFTHLDFAVNVREDQKIVKRPAVWFAHNTFQFTAVRSAKDMAVIYNSAASYDLCRYDNPGFVFPPPVDMDYYRVERGENVTLVNLNVNKGGEVLYKIAELMTDVYFIGVRGSYGGQVVKSLPNVTILPNQKDIREAYKQTKILLMPSKYESWGRTATEAMASGIPVICTDTFGLRENCGDAAIYCNRERPEQWVEAIREVFSNYTYYSEKSLARAEMLRPKWDEFENFIINHSGKL